MEAPAIFLAAVVGTGIAIVTRHRGPSLTLAEFALVTHGASAPIRATGLIMGVCATFSRTAGVVSADIAVIAVQRATGGARSCQTNI